MEEEKHYVEFQFKVYVSIKNITYRGSLLGWSVDKFIEFKNDFSEYENLIKKHIEVELKDFFGISTYVSLFEDHSSIDHSPYQTKLVYLVYMRSDDGIILDMVSYEKCMETILNDSNTLNTLRIPPIKTKELSSKKTITICFENFRYLGIKSRGYEKEYDKIE